MLYAQLSRWRALLALPWLTLPWACTTTISDGGMPGGAGNDVATSGGASTAGTGSSGASATGAGGTAGVGGITASAGTSAGSGTTGGQPSSSVGLKGTPAYHRFVRLTHEQWEASVRDILKLSTLPGMSSSFASDPPNGTFSNNERALFVSSTLWSDYQRAAEELSSRVVADAQALSRVTGGTKDSAAFIRDFGRRAFRRPLTQGEQDTYQTLFASGPTLVGSGDAFADGVQLVVQTMLQSPNFLYRSELGSDGARLSGYELASKLSFLFRGTTPDDALLDAAAAGELDSPSGVAARASAMLKDDGAKAALGRYHAELFGLARYNSIDKNRSKFPAYTEALNAEFEQADRLFLDRIFTSDQGLREILTSPLAFVSASTAKLYGVSASGTQLVETQLGPERPGLLTRLGFLAYNANLSEPDPIHRGVDVINRLMCADLMPPANIAIPPLPTAEPGQTNRERVTAHTGDGTCGQGCHSTIINPLGFAFEGFDALGQLRTMDNGQPVDTTGVFHGAGEPRPFTTAAELVGILATDPSVHACYAKHLAEYTLARDVTERDRPLIDQVETLSLDQSASVKAIVLAIVGHPSFLTRTGGT